MKKNNLMTAGGICLLVLSAAALLGTHFLFHACGPKEDGSYMTCHYAQSASEGTAAVLAVLALLLLISKSRSAMKAYAAAMVPVSVLMILIPNTLIPLCMMPDMRCRSVMRPAVLVIGILILLISAVLALVPAKERGADSV